MKIKNISSKVIYFGSIGILPNDVKEVGNSPLIETYKKLKLIEIDGEKKPDKTDKPIGRQTLEELRIIAAELKIEFAETDTKQILIDKINQKKAEENGQNT